MTGDEEIPQGRNAERDAQILALRNNGASWLQISEAFGLTRQQARYCYQRGKREERRGQRRAT